MPAPQPHSPVLLQSTEYRTYKVDIRFKLLSLFMIEMDNFFYYVSHLKGNLLSNRSGAKGQGHSLVDSS